MTTVFSHKKRLSDGKVKYNPSLNNLNYICKLQHIQSIQFKHQLKAYYLTLTLLGLFQQIQQIVAELDEVPQSDAHFHSAPVLHGWLVICSDFLRRPRNEYGEKTCHKPYGFSDVYDLNDLILVNDDWNIHLMPSFLYPHVREQAVMQRVNWSFQENKTEFYLPLVTKRKLNQQFDSCTYKSSQ